MKTRSLIFFSFLAILIFPQYAFSVDLPSPSSNSTGSGSTNNATSNPPPISASSNSSLTGGNPPANNTSQKTNNTSAISPNSTSSITNKTSSVTVTPNPASNQGSQITFAARVVDTSSSPTTPTGTISWSDGDAGGTFSQVSCALSTGVCTTVYIPPTGVASSITITARYQGDSTHLSASNTSTLTVIIQRST